jgi:hypothetical protein
LKGFNMYINPLEENRSLLGANPSTYTPTNLPQPAMPSMTQPQPQLLSHGGMADPHHSEEDSGDMIAAHFNPRELDYLDHLQGATVRVGPKRMRSYKDLEGVAANPHIMSNIHMHTREHLANGGAAGPMHKAEAYDGRYGDTELGEIGPHLRHLLDIYAGHKTKNPYDGHPEYFSLSGLLGGFGKAIGGIPLIGGALSSVAQNVLPMAGTAIGTMLGGPMGGMIGGQGANMLSNTMFGGQGGGAPQAQAPAYNPSMGMGSQLRNAAFSALGNHFGQQSSPLGQGVSAGFNAMANGQGLRGAANSAFQGAGGMQGLQRAGMDAFNAYRGGGQSPAAALRYGASSYLQPQMGPQQMPQGYQQPMNQQQPMQQQPMQMPQPYQQFQQQQQMPMGTRMPQMYNDLD